MKHNKWAINLTPMLDVNYHLRHFNSFFPFYLLCTSSGSFTYPKSYVMAIVALATVS